MAARDRPTLGIAHLTVVPRNFEPEEAASDPSESDDESDAGHRADAPRRS